MDDDSGMNIPLTIHHTGHISLVVQLYNKLMNLW